MNRYQADIIEFLGEGTTIKETQHYVIVDGFLNHQNIYCLDLLFNRGLILCTTNGEQLVFLKRASIDNE